MFLSFEQIKEITVGAVHMENIDGDMRFYKYFPYMIPMWGEIKETLAKRARNTTGIRLDFHTNSKHLNLEIEEPAKFEIYIDGFFRYTMKDTQSLSVDIDTPHGEPLEDARVTVYFPSHKEGKLKFVELDDGAYVRRHDFDRKILFMGDSITQGWESGFDTLSFASKVSRYFNAESVIQGVGGACFHPEFLEQLPIDFDWVIVAYGTNDFAFRKDFDEFYTYMCEYMAKLSRIYGDKRVFVISPIWRVLTENETSERFEKYRSAIVAEAEKYGFIHIDGAHLVPPISDLYTDGVHPNCVGFSLYAENLINIIKEKDRGIFNEKN